MTNHAAPRGKHTERCFWSVADAATEDYMLERAIPFLDGLTDDDQAHIMEWTATMLDSDDYCTCDEEI